MLSDSYQPQHILTIFKEYTGYQQRSLKYVTSAVVSDLARSYDIIISLLPSYGHILHLSRKLKLILSNQLDFSWFTCHQHRDILKGEFSDVSIHLIIRKHLDDNYRNFQSNKKKCDHLKIKKFQHL